METKLKTNSLSTIRTLTLMQLGDKLDVAAFKINKKFWLKLLFRFIILVFAIVIIYAVLSVAQNMLQAPVTGDLLLFILILMQVMGVVTCTLGLLKTLYQSKDNALLLSFPANHSDVFVSKIIVYYILEFLRTITFLLPFLFAYGIFKINTLHWTYFINALVLTALLPLLCVLLSALLSLPVMFLVDFLKGQTIISSILVIAIVGALFYAVVSFLESLPADLNLVAYYKKVLVEFSGFLSRVGKFGLYLIFAKNILSAASISSIGMVFANYGLLLAVIVGLTAMTIFLTMPFYFKVASHAVEMAQVKHVTKMRAHNSTFGVFLAKEFKLSLRDSNAMLSNFMYLMLMPFLLFIINKVFSLVDVNIIGRKAFLAVNICLGLIMVMVSNTSSATAISSEGNEFYLLKTAPSKTKQIAWAKITVNLIFSTLAIIASTICIKTMTDFTTAELLHIFYIFMAVNTSHVLWSFEFDLMKPQVKQFIATGTTQDNVNANKSMALGVGLAFIFSGLFALMLFSDERGVDNVKVAWIKILCIVTAFLAARIYLFKTKLELYFDDIEM